MATGPNRYISCKNLVLGPRDTGAVSVRAGTHKHGPHANRKIRETISVRMDREKLRCEVEGKTVWVVFHIPALGVPCPALP